MLRTPPSLKEEHEEIMTSLNQFSKLPDITGRSVSKPGRILDPCVHWECWKRKNHLGS